MRFEIAADTDRGIVKETNQDSLLVKCFSTCKGDMAFAVLCDGMGGLSKGELASATVVRAFDRWSDEQLPELCKSSNPDIDSLILERQWDEVIQQQNEKIKAYGKAHAVNMGTTGVALLVTQKAYYIINVGDSRIYSLSDHIERLTTDQTYVQREIMNGNMTQEQAMKDPRRNVLLQCVGSSASEVMKKAGIKITEKMSEQLIKKIPIELIKSINKAVGFRLLTKAGQTGIVNLDDE